MMHQPQPDAHFSGRRLTIARVAWVVAVALFFGTYLAAIPGFLTRTSQIPSIIAGFDWTEAELRFALAQAGLSVEAYARFTAWWVLLEGGVFWVVAIFIFWRKSEDRMVFLLSTCFIVLGAAPAVFKVPLEILAESQPVWGSLARALNIPWLICLPLVFYLFPNGHWTPGWTRWMYLVWVGYFSLTTIGPSALQVYKDHPVLSTVSVLVLIGSLPIAQLYRYRYVSGPLERQQIKWVVFGLTVGTLAVLIIGSSSLIIPDLLRPTPVGVLYAFSIGYLEWTIFNGAIPVSIAIAILRSRLWDIDLLIRRTLQYSMLSGLLALVYFGLIISLQGIFTAVSSQQSAVATVLSTLAIAALFLPLRRRVQAFIDKRFYRQKYDAQKVLAEFAATARDETDLDTLTTRLVDVVQETMQPEKVTLWLRDPDAGVAKTRQ